MVLGAVVVVVVVVAAAAFEALAGDEGLVAVAGESDEIV